MATAHMSRTPPSTRWTSFDCWDYNGMKQRLEGLLAMIDKSALVRHAEQIKGQKVTMSQPFSAGQYWVCLEMVAEDHSLVIARVRLPRHPDMLSSVSEEDEKYSISCEVATMTFVRQNLPGLAIPRVYAYEGPGSQLAAQAGATYMLLEGFYGNTLQDVEFDMCILPVATQEHIITQWTKVQVELATLSYPQIGSISSVTTTGEPVIDRLASASAEGMRCGGPFSDAAEYFTVVAEAAIRKLDTSDAGSLAALGTHVFHDIVQRTSLFNSDDHEGSFPLNHMDLGTQNILVDDHFNFQAIIDWEFAQTAPWQVNYYPMPFPLQSSDAEIQDILRHPDHCAHKNVKRQELARRMYSQKFRGAETELETSGRPLGGSFAKTLDSPASRIYACFARLGDLPASDECLLREMVRLAFDLDADGTERYLQEIDSKVKRVARKEDGSGVAE